jgi:hypothetical protein
MKSYVALRTFAGIDPRVKRASLFANRANAHIHSRNADG